MEPLVVTEDDPAAAGGAQSDCVEDCWVFFMSCDPGIAAACRAKLMLC